MAKSNSKFAIDKNETVDKSIYFYQQGGFGTLNDLLWQKPVDYWGKKGSVYGTMNTVKSNVQRAVNLASSMDQTQNNMRVFSGTRSGYFKDFNEWQPGKEITLKGFTSSSSQKYVASSFADARDGEKNVVFIIDIPKGSYAKNFDNGEFEHEKEVLIPPSSFVIERVEEGQDGTIEVYVRQTELLSMQELITGGLNHIKEGLDKKSTFKNKHIDKLQKEIDEGFEYVDIPYRAGVLPIIENVSLEEIDETGYYEENSKEISVETQKNRASKKKELETTIQR